MSTISAALSDSRQSDVSAAAGYMRSAVLSLDSNVTLLNNYLLTVSEFLDQPTLDALTAKVAAVAADAANVHANVNQIAIMGEDAFGVARGTWYGSGSSVVTPASGGTDKA